ncbi:hypothetical protein [Mesorhizobium sp. M0643]|uniref:hypothetical protein n=1 Tax=Mesorhizobium sp. M0643 TaxID=2956978 RepID=UPI00333561FE
MGDLAARILQYRVATSPGEITTMMRAVKPTFNVASPAGGKLIHGRFLDLPFWPVIRGRWQFAACFCRYFQVMWKN